MEPALTTLLLLSAFPALAAVVSSNQTVQTELSFVPGPDQRGTLELFWNCTTTFILCIWTAVHPDVVPVQGGWARVYYKVCLMTWATIIPELMLCKAVVQLRQAWHVLKVWKHRWRGDDDRQKWLGLSGAFFVVMGGYVVELEQPSQLQYIDVSYVEDGKPVTSDRREKPQSIVTTIGAQGFKDLLNDGIIEQRVKDGTLSKCHFDHTRIEDSGKANNIAKLIITVQILWMVIQCIGRKATGLPVTILEVHVLIQISYSVLAYACWWNKPLDIASPIALPLKPDDLLRYNVSQDCKKYFKYPRFMMEESTHRSFTHMWFRAAYDVLVYLPLQYHVEFWGAGLSIINASLHSVVWTYHFPTTAERTLWRIAAIGIGVCPSVVYTMIGKTGFNRHFVRVWYIMRFEDGSCLTILPKALSVMKDACLANIENRGLGDEDKVPPEKDQTPPPLWPENVPYWLRVLLLGLCNLGMLLYVTCILYLTLEAFISLRSLPVGAYATVRWADWVPHF
jgi:hypothetical protein